MERCKQCDGQGFLMIATPVLLPEGEMLTVNAAQCLLCNDSKRWRYALRYIAQYGMCPPKKEMWALDEPGAQIIRLKHRANPEPQNTPTGPRIV